MFFNLINGINRLIKEINRLLSKGMSVSYLKVSIEKNWLSQNFNFSSLKNLLPGHFLGSSNSRRYYLNFLLQLRRQRSGSKTVGLFYYFNF